MNLLCIYGTTMYLLYTCLGMAPAAFIFCPRLIMGMLQEDPSSLSSMVRVEYFLDIDVRGNDISGSVNITAVAGTVRGIRKELSSCEEKIEITAAPCIPFTRDDTSAAMTTS